MIQVIRALWKKSVISILDVCVDSLLSRRRGEEDRHGSGWCWLKVLRENSIFIRRIWKIERGEESATFFAQTGVCYSFSTTWCSEVSLKDVSVEALASRASAGTIWLSLDRAAAIQVKHFASSHQNMKKKKNGLVFSGDAARLPCGPFPRRRSSTSDRSCRRPCQLLPNALGGREHFSQLELGAFLYI